MFDSASPVMEELFRELFIEARPSDLSFRQREQRVARFEQFESMVAAAKSAELATYHSELDPSDVGHLGELLGLELSISAVQSQAMVVEALDITGELRPIHDALAAGSITVRHAKVLRQVISRMLVVSADVDRD